MFSSQKTFLFSRLCVCIALGGLLVMGGCADTAPEPDTVTGSDAPKPVATVPASVQVGPPK